MSAICSGVGTLSPENAMIGSRVTFETKSLPFSFFVMMPSALSS